MSANVSHPHADAPQDEREVVPVVEETASVARTRTITGRVRVQKRVVAHDVPVDVALGRERVQVTRHRVGREISEAPPVRQEGDTTIVPVVEERLVLVKRLVLREEIHITRVRTNTHARKDVRLRREEVDVERIDESGDAAPPGAAQPGHGGR